MNKPIPNREFRVVPTTGLELRAAADKRTIAGYAAVFGAIADIGGYFRETIARGAFAAAIGRDDVRALIDHDPSMILGRNKAGTLRLSEDDHGLKVEIDPPDTQLARDIVVSLERGDVSQMSFGFRTRKQQWDETQDPPLRTIQEVELFDVSIVTFPAYADTEVGLRSLAEHRATGVSSSTAANIARRLRMRHGLKVRELAR